MNRANAQVWNRVRARRAIARKIPTEFRHYPEPRSIGSFDAGQKLKQGVFELAGEQLTSPTRSIWSLDAPAGPFTEEMHGFDWLDDLAAVGDAQARELAQAWVLDWIHRYGNGTGEGWAAALTGRRVLRICSHARFIQHNLDRGAQGIIFRSLARQLNYLGKSWKTETAGLRRLEALAGLVFAGVSFAGRANSLASANKAIGAECEQTIASDGSIATRNPEELMDVFTLLTWVYRTLEDAGTQSDPRLIAALEELAPVLRALRLGDGSLARFHGGGRGRPGRLDQGLSDSHIRGTRSSSLAMGFDRITAARITVVVDCANPPAFNVSKHAHASTLAFEMSSSRQPMLVNCGSGRAFGPKWEHVARATGAHNTVVVGGTSSSTIEKPGFVSRTFGERLLKGPKNVTRQRSSDRLGSWLLVTHDGYEKTHGVIHQRRLFLSPDGTELRGQDTVSAISDAGKKIVDAAFTTPFDAHFHLHPDVHAKLSEDGESVTLRLRGNEAWIFKAEGGQLGLEKSVYLDQWRLKPRATKQIVVSSRIMEYSGQITWIFKRIQNGEPTSFAQRESNP